MKTIGQDSEDNFFGVEEPPAKEEPKAGDKDKSISKYTGVQDY